MVKASGVVISMFALLLTGNDGNDDKDDYDDGNDDKGRGGGWGARSLDQGGEGRQMDHEPAHFQNNTKKWIHNNSLNR